MVLLLFTWWGQKADNVPEVMHQWREAIIDLRRTLEVMGTMAHKRTTCGSRNLSLPIVAPHDLKPLLGGSKVSNPMTTINYVPK